MTSRLFVFLLSWTASSYGQAPSSQPASRSTNAGTNATVLVLRLNPFIDMHYMVRKCAGGQLDAPKIDGWKEAMEVAKAAEIELGGLMGWGIIEGMLSSVDGSAPLLAACDRLPETFTTRSGKTIAIRETTRRLATAYAKIEPAFMKDIWPAHRTKLEKARADVEKGLLPKQRQCYDDILRDLAMEDPKLTIPVYLVVEAPRPGAFTHRARGGGGVCFVGIEPFSGPLLYETILHESIHALDIATERQETALKMLRDKLRAAGFDESSRVYHDVPHTLMFVQPAETVRRVIDPNHKDYGEVSGYYRRVPEAAQAVLGPWREYLGGVITREAAIQRIVGFASKGASATSQGSGN